MDSGVLDWHILADQGRWDACCVQIIQQEAERTLYLAVGQVIPGPV